MKKYLAIFTILIGVCISNNVQASAQSDYEVKMPEQSLLRAGGIEVYSQEIRNINQEEIENLPEEEQQDAIRAVLEVIADLNREQIDAITQMKEESLESWTFKERVDAGTGADAATWINFGDILITLDSAFKEWEHGHAGIADYYKDHVIEAAGYGKGVRRAKNYKTYWAKQNTDELYVGKASQAQYKKAVEFATQQIGKTYNIATTLSNNSQWYCSKLVYRAWLAAGYDVGGNKVNIAGIQGVLPKEILWDDNVFWYQKVK